MKAWIIAVLAGGLWACNNEATNETTDTDKTQVADSSITPGYNPVVTDTVASPAKAGIDSAQLDTPKKVDTR